MKYQVKKFLKLRKIYYAGAIITNKGTYFLSDTHNIVSNEFDPRTSIIRSKKKDAISDIDMLGSMLGSFKEHLIEIYSYGGAYCERF